MTRIIKKYPNRRLYDTEFGNYITLDDVKKLVLERVEFQVMDARTSKDLTQNTLLQIITEQETTSTPIFTNALLQDFIRSYHEKSQNIFTEYLEQVMNLFIHQKEIFQTQWLSYQKLLTDPVMVEKILTMQKSLATHQPVTAKTSRSKSTKKSSSRKK